MATAMAATCASSMADSARAMAAISRSSNCWAAKPRSTRSARSATPPAPSARKKTARRWKKQLPRRLRPKVARPQPKRSSSQPGIVVEVSGASAERVRFVFDARLLLRTAPLQAGVCRLNRGPSTPLRMTDARGMARCGLSRDRMFCFLHGFLPAAAIDMRGPRVEQHLHHERAAGVEGDILPAAGARRKKRLVDFVQRRGDQGE